VSIFVNPTQFGPDEDLEAYPRDLDGDESALHGLGDAAPDIVFAPPVEEVYPGERRTTVTVERLTEVLCGARRPGHFDGVTTVVSKLFHMVEPDVAVFGRKDFQQLAVIRQMVRDLDMSVVVVGAPLIREPDGLAMSSRNAYLSVDERRAALALPRALRAAVEAARDARQAGHRPDAGMLRDAAVVTLHADPEVRLDYLEVVDPRTLTPPDAPHTRGEADQRGSGTTGDGGAAAGPQLLVAVAAFVGPARLIDNVVVGDLADEDRLLAATGE
jgi:pantoate--beta-alanine ligase